MVHGCVPPLTSISIRQSYSQNLGIGNINISNQLPGPCRTSREHDRLPWHAAHCPCSARKRGHRASAPLPYPMRAIADMRAARCLDIPRRRVRVYRHYHMFSLCHLVLPPVYTPCKVRGSRTYRCRSSHDVLPAECEYLSSSRIAVLSSARP